MMDIIVPVLGTGLALFLAYKLIRLLIRGIYNLYIFIKYSAMDRRTRDENLRTEQRCREEEEEKRREEMRREQEMWERMQRERASSRQHGENRKEQNFHEQNTGYRKSQESQNSRKRGDYQRTTASTPDTSASSTRDIIRKQYGVCRTKDELKLRRRQLLKRYHPDNYHDDGTMFRIVESVYEELQSCI